jgi:protein-arginine deiminase
MPIYYAKNGTQRSFDSGYVNGSIVIQKPIGVRVFGFRTDNEQPRELIAGEALSVTEIYPDYLILVPMSDKVGEFTLQNIDSSGAVVSDDLYVVVSFPVLLDCDADRDTNVEFNEQGKSNWTWSSNGKGAILLVNNDKELSDTTPLPGQRSEFGELIIRSSGYDELPHDLELRLYATPDAARRFAIYRVNSDGTLLKVLGKKLDETDADVINLSAPLQSSGERLYVEAHEYPGPFFEGLITVELHLRVKRPDMAVGPLLASDRVVYRVAPWIMLPNTLPVEEVYTCEINRGTYTNEKFIEGLQAACDYLGLPLNVVPQQENYGDRWIQDEIEIGYSESPSHAIHVVYDSPRDRGLDDFPEKRLLGPDFGHFQIGGSSPNSLDSFGNLEISPPVTVNNRHYPFGRIIFGGRSYGDFGPASRQMMPEIRRFLYAQKIQSPIEIFTDWLAVGHVDEIICFVPEENSPKGFRLLLASPKKARRLLQTLQAAGHGSAVLFEGKKRLDGTSAEISIDELLADRDFWNGNDVYQEYMNLNQASLLKHLALETTDVIEIPVLFKVERDGTGNLQRTLAYFPDMVNHLVSGNVSIVPKPYGPQINGQCAFEQALSDSLPDRELRFIDDWYSYHELSGEVHCGTNVRRKPSGEKWWEYLPDGGFDI